MASDCPRRANYRFNYDRATQRLLSATNPENGTVSYTYNADGSMATRLDAKGQKTAYSYDTYGRLTQIRHYPNGTNEDTAQQVNLYYDNNYAGSGPNTWGRLAAAANGHVTEIYGYTSAGLLTSKQVGVTSGGLSGYTWGALAYTYNNEGQVTSVSYPSTTVQDGLGGWKRVPRPVYDYSYDNLGRAAGMTQEDTSATLVNNVQYGPAGEMQQMQDVGTNRLNTFQYNSLVQLTRTTTRYSGVVNMDVQYTYS
ncbi:MAG: hypothetical protein LAN64_20525, partial [Acidobacteriia bacterium]|nr:hypothetical protein [Terriglobia bacterium]